MTSFNSQTNTTLPQTSKNLPNNSNSLDCEPNQELLISPRLSPPTTTESNGNKILKPTFLNSSLTLNNATNHTTSSLLMDKAELYWQRVQVALANEAKGIPSETATRHKEFVQLMSFGNKNCIQPSKDLKMVGRHPNQPDKLDEFVWYQDMEKLVRDAIQKNTDIEVSEFRFKQLMNACCDTNQTMDCLNALDHELYRATNYYHMQDFFIAYQKKNVDTAKMRTRNNHHQ
jgi:hypothetical protein